MGEKLFLFADLVFFCILKYQMFISLFSKSERFREGFQYFSHLMMEKKQEVFFCLLFSFSRCILNHLENSESWIQLLERDLNGTSYYFRLSNTYFFLLEPIYFTF